MSDIVRIVLRMYPQDPPEKQMPGELLEALERHSGFSPSHWGTGERVRHPYSREAAMAKAGGESFRSCEIYLHRDKPVKYSAFFDFGRRPFLKLDLKGSFPKARWPELLDLADSIAAAVKPRFGALHIFRPTSESWATENDRWVEWMTFGASPTPVLFQDNGPLALAMRTYFGPDMVELFGRELLLETPGVTKALEWGGVRIDLAEDMFQIAQSELAVLWKHAMDHLAPSQVFAEPVFEDDGRTISFRPARRWISGKQAVR